MKKITKIGAALLAVCSLASCASKCDFAKFQEKVKAIEESPYKTAVVKGWYKNKDGEKHNLKEEVSLDKISVSLTGDFAIAAGLVLETVALFAVAESADCKYYAGTSFKVVGKDDEGNKGTWTWNKYGMLTSEKTDSSSYKITYKK